MIEKLRPAPVDTLWNASYLIAATDGVDMYRMRIYESAGENVAESTRIFQELVRPVHEKYGARLVGRWFTDDGKIVVIWQYRDIEHCRACLQSVKEDEGLKRSLPLREESGLAGVARSEVFMTSTLPNNGSPE